MNNNRPGGFIALIVTIALLFAIANDWFWLTVAIGTILFLFGLGQITGFNGRLYETIRRIWLGYP